jgi:hypothetical protein
MRFSLVKLQESGVYGLRGHQQPVLTPHPRSTALLMVETERTLMPPRGGVNRRDDQIKTLFPEKLELHWPRRLDRPYQAVRPPLMCRTTGGG